MQATFTSRSRVTGPRHAGWLSVRHGPSISARGPLVVIRRSPLALGGLGLVNVTRTVAGVGLVWCGNDGGAPVAALTLVLHCPRPIALPPWPVAVRLRRSPVCCPICTAHRERGRLMCGRPGSSSYQPRARAGAQGWALFLLLLLRLASCSTWSRRGSTTWTLDPRPSTATACPTQNLGRITPLLHVISASPVPSAIPIGTSFPHSLTHNPWGMGRPARLPPR